MGVLRWRTCSDCGDELVVDAADYDRLKASIEEDILGALNAQLQDRLDDCEIEISSMGKLLERTLEHVPAGDPLKNEIRVYLLQRRLDALER